MTEQNLDDPDIDTVLEEMGRETVAQRVRPDPLADLRRLRGLGDDPVQMRTERRLLAEQR